MRRSTQNFNIPPLPNPEDWTEDKIPTPSGQNGFQMLYLIVGFVCQMPLLKNNHCRLLSSLIKLVYKHANMFRDPLYDGAIFTDLSYYKNTTLTLKLLKNDLKLN